MMLARWVTAVLNEIPSWAPISLLVLPSTMSATNARLRSVVHKVQGLLQIFPRFPFRALIVRPQQVRRVVGDDDGDVLPIKPLAAHLGNPFLVSGERSRGGASQGADGLGPNGHQLAVQELPANLHFVRFRCPVPRRAALDDVADVDILARHLDAFLTGGVLDHLGEQLACAPDKGNPRSEEHTSELQSPCNLV